MNHIVELWFTSFGYLLGAFAWVGGSGYLFVKGMFGDEPIYAVIGIIMGTAFLATFTTILWSH